MFLEASKVPSETEYSCTPTAAIKASLSVILSSMSIYEPFSKAIGTVCNLEVLSVMNRRDCPKIDRFMPNGPKRCSAERPVGIKKTYVEPRWFKITGRRQQNPTSAHLRLSRASTNPFQTSVTLKDHGLHKIGGYHKPLLAGSAICLRLC